jgi:eukaryotic-like serine/threonine-protein kinase
MPAPFSSETAEPAVPSWSLGLTSSERPHGPQSEWVSRQVKAMAAAWALGEQITARELLEQYPELSSENAIRLVYEEVCLRREAGENVVTAEVVARFPQWRDELELLLGCDRLLWPLSRAAVFPEVGEQLGPFRLLSELGQGASGKTYLASEPALADRLVVLKVIPDDQEEHLSLARLQHTHIIPLFSEQTFPDRGLRALCMPYFGGASLARVLEALAEVPPDRRRGRHILEALGRGQAGHLPLPASDEGPYRRYLDQASYIQAVCWIVACLADALHEAHAHGLLHMDVKPSNVLIAADGLPMLLDFHLARKPIKAGERVSDRLGGTPGWMAPEQAAALKAVSLGQPVPEPVNRCADLYPLGLLLREALCGPGAGAEGATERPWQCRNPQVSAGLTDIVEKCLAVKPSERYRDAASLADDLRRHLNDLPLRGVANRSFRERWRKWRRRRPAALARGTAWSFTLAALVVAATTGYAFYRQRVREVETDLDDGQKLRVERRFAEAVRVLSRGLERASAIPVPDHLEGMLSKQLHLAKLGQKAGELHHLADLVRFWYGSTPPAGKEAQNLIAKVPAIWEERNLLLKPQGEALDAESEQGIRTDLLELAVVWADLRVRLASKSEVDEARREAWRVLDQAEAICGPSPALNRELRAYAQALGETRSFHEPDPAPRSAWEHYDLGRSYLRSGLVREAAGEFQRTLELRPQDFWPNFFQGLCAYELGEFEEAAAAFRTCIALAPSTAECYYNRARAADAQEHARQAFSDYSRALELDPGLAVAALNRGILSYKASRYDDAIADFHRALGASPDSEIVGRTHYNLALTHQAKGDRTSALASVQEAVALGYRGASDLRDNLQRGR